MCLILFAKSAHPSYKLIVLANRDEFHERSSQKAHWWADSNNLLLAGKDLKAGGTWLGINKKGKFGAITNHRDPKNIDPKAPSRGHLLTDFFKESSTSSYLKKLQTTDKKYNGFNLLIGSVDTLFHYSNISNEIQEVKDGIWGLSNALFDTSWPKVDNGKEKLKKLLTEEKINIDRAFELLKDPTIAKDENLPNTGIGIIKERFLSPICISVPGYGTRTSTILLVDNSNNVYFEEREFILKSNVVEEFKINAD